MEARRIEDGLDEDEAFMRSLTRCEEDRRRLYPHIEWRGEYRWFRAANIVPLERFRPFKWRNSGR
jgi:hypothetical protein